MTAATNDCAGPDWTAGHALIASLAATGRPFTANDCRAQLREYGFTRFDSGALFQAAKAEGVIRKVGVDVSSDRPSHGAYVRRWIGTQHGALATLIPTRETVTVPVQRDRGRFVSGVASFVDVPLPMEVTP